MSMCYQHKLQLAGTCLSGHVQISHWHWFLLQSPRWYLWQKSKNPRQCDETSIYPLVIVAEEFNLRLPKWNPCTKSTSWHILILSWVHGSWTRDIGLLFNSWSNTETLISWELSLGVSWLVKKNPPSDNILEPCLFWFDTLQFTVLSVYLQVVTMDRPFVNRSLIPSNMFLSFQRNMSCISEIWDISPKLTPVYLSYPPPSNKPNSIYLTPLLTGLAYFAMSFIIQLMDIAGPCCFMLIREAVIDRFDCNWSFSWVITWTIHTLPTGAWTRHHVKSL